MVRRKFLIPAAAITLMGIGGSAHADVILYVNDTSANIGQVDITTQSVVAGSVHNTGLPADNSGALSDLAFGSNGTLYGTTFNNLYSVNPNTGALALIGSFGAVGGGEMNALVGSGGTALLGASAATNEVYTIDPTNASASVFASSPAPSAGDLAFSGSTLYEAGVSSNGNDELINVTTNSAAALFHVNSASGAELNDVLGIANDGTTTYAVAGTEVYSVNLSDAILTPLFDYASAEGGQTLSQARGAAFIGEGSSTPSGGGSPTPPATPAPEPASLLLVGSGILGLGLMRRLRVR